VRIQHGERAEIIARVLGVDRSTVDGWLARYQRGGWNGLNAKPLSGRPSKLDGKNSRLVYDTVASGFASPWPATGAASLGRRPVPWQSCCRMRGEAAERARWRCRWTMTRFGAGANSTRNTGWRQRQRSDAAPGSRTRGTGKSQSAGVARGACPSLRPFSYIPGQAWGCAPAPARSPPNVLNLIYWLKSSLIKGRNFSIESLYRKWDCDKTT
jgi:hypothetical protein